MPTIPPAHSTSPSRRRFLSRSAVASGVVLSAPLLRPQPANASAAARLYSPARYRGAPLLRTRERHLVGRFSYGITPGLAAQVRRAGGAEAWFEAQLSPVKISDTRAQELVTWWSGLSRDAGELWQRQASGVEGGWEVMQDYARWVLVRRMQSRRQVLEVMTEFWENHFNVPVTGDSSFTHRVPYGAAIGAQALGRFEDLLQTAITHPAMLIYLDQAVSTAKHPNENLGRELLELHTVGRGAYAEDDVKSSARILTGWKVDVYKTWTPSYSTTDHWRGPVSVMEFSEANGSPDGRDLTRRYLSYLAHHPSTARRLARKLAVKFVSDDPSDALVTRLADVYLAGGTAIKPVLRELIASPEFAESVGQKVRDPGEDLVASYRLLRTRLSPPPEGDEGDRFAANVMLWQVENIGTKPFGWPRPDGQPIDNESWSTPSRMLASMEMHYALSGRWWPKEGIRFRPPRAWMPQRAIRFDRLVDHLSQQLLHRRSTGALLQACCEAVDTGPRERITRKHPVYRWLFPRLLTTFLDSPAHLTR